MLFEMTRQRALELGLLFCTCGHPENNHFDYEKKACAHCECKEYIEVGKSGCKIIDDNPKLKGPSRRRK